MKRNTQLPLKRINYCRYNYSAVNVLRFVLNLFIALIFYDPPGAKMI